MDLEKISKLQQEDGSFGPFHSMSSTSPLTTEKILRRFMFLNLKKDNPIVNKTLNYVKRCLSKEISIPDRREKVLDWDVFLDLMFSSWLNIFDDLTIEATDIKNKWIDVISKSIENEKFNIYLYETNYEEMFGKLKSRMRVIDPTNFYMVSLLRNSLDSDVSKAYFKYIENMGIYYIYGSTLADLPRNFDSKATINYLYAIKLAANYDKTAPLLASVKKWILDNKQEDYWYLNNLKPDGIIFPLAKDWQSQQRKLNDIKTYINSILNEL